MFGGFKATLNLLGGKGNENRSELSSDSYVTGAYRVNRENIYGYSFTTQDVPISKPAELPPTLRPVKSTGNLEQPPKTVNQKIRKSNPAISNHPRGEDHTNETGLSRKESKFREKEQRKIEKQQAAQRKKEAKEKARQEKLKEKARKEEQKAIRNANKKQGKATQIQAQPQTSTNNQPQPHTSTPVARPVKTTPVTTTKLPVNKTTQQPVTKTPQTVTETPQPADKTKEPAKNTKPPAPPASKTTQLANKTTQPANKTTQPANKTTQPANKTRQSASNTDRESSISRSSGPPPYSELPEPIQPKTDTTGNVVYSKPVDTGSWDIISQHREQMNRPAVTSSKRKEVVMDLNYFGGARNNADNSEA